MTNTFYRNSVLAAIGIMAMSLSVVPCASARTFDFKALGTKGSSTGGTYWYSTAEKKKSAFFQVKVGSAGKLDDKSKMEIRAASVFKNASDKRTGVNDVATISFDPVNAMKPLFFVVATGAARSQTDRYWADSKRSSGWQLAGVIIEIWQAGKVVKHWTNIPGNGGKAKLAENVKQLFIHANGYTMGECDFDNETEIVPVNQKGEKADLEDLLKDCAEPDKTDDAPADASETGRKDADENEVDGAFVLKSFCGFEFGSAKPAFSRRGNDREITLRKPFRHYTRARLVYGSKSGLLQSVELLSNQKFETDVERMEAAAAAAAVIEKRYGITMEDFGGSFHFGDDLHDIWLYATSISVVRRDLQEKDEMLRNSIREAAKRKIDSSKNSDDGSDVL